jgi:hypothetical protein
MHQLDEVAVLEELDSLECWRLIVTQAIGRVAFVVDGEPAVLPVSFAVAGSMVVFRTALGSAFDRLVRDVEVAFEVDHADPAYHSGWSVVGRGIARGIEGRLSTGELSGLSLRPWGLQVAPGWIGIELREVTGRRIVQGPGLIEGSSSSLW